MIILSHKYKQKSRQSVYNNMSEHKPKPFTKDIAEQMKLGIAASFDEKETYSCSKESVLNPRNIAQGNWG
tara:strand:+ start:323 stop:532 length:210 start_codon:yes stop_codon:yes gene_type:complete